MSHVSLPRLDTSSTDDSDSEYEKVAVQLRQRVTPEPKSFGRFKEIVVNVLPVALGVGAAITAREAEALYGAVFENTLLDCREAQSIARENLEEAVCTFDSRDNAGGTALAFASWVLFGLFVLNVRVSSFVEALTTQRESLRNSEQFLKGKVKGQDLGFARQVIDAFTPIKNHFESGVLKARSDFDLRDNMKVLFGGAYMFLSLFFLFYQSHARGEQNESVVEAAQSSASTYKPYAMFDGQFYFFLSILFEVMAINNLMSFFSQMLDDRYSGILLDIMYYLTFNKHVSKGIRGFDFNI